MIGMRVTVARKTRQLLSKPESNKIRRQLLTTRKSTNGSPQALFTEKYEEDPVIVMSEKDDVDIIGPPNSISNLRPIIRKKMANETDLQRQLRELQDATQMWNQEFWSKHNTAFIKESREFVRRKQTEGGHKNQLSAEEMSEFYKNFLDKNWQRHLDYNFEWYKRNFAMLVLAFRVSLEKYLRKIR